MMQCQTESESTQNGLLSMENLVNQPNSNCVTDDRIDSVLIGKNEPTSLSGSIKDIIKPDDAFSFVEVIRQFIIEESSHKNTDIQKSDVVASNRSLNTMDSNSSHKYIQMPNGNLDSKFPETTNTEESIEFVDKKKYEFPFLLSLKEQTQYQKQQHKMTQNDDSKITTSCMSHTAFIPFDHRINLLNENIEPSCWNQRINNDNLFKFPAKNWQNFTEKSVSSINTDLSLNAINGSIEKSDILPNNQANSFNEHYDDYDVKNIDECLGSTSDQNQSSTFNIPIVSGTNQLSNNFTSSNLIKPIFQSTKLNSFDPSSDIIGFTENHPDIVSSFPKHHLASTTIVGKDNNTSTSNITTNNIALHQLSEQAINGAGNALVTQSPSSNGHRLDSTNLYLTGFGPDFTFTELECLLNDFKPIMSYRIINGDTDYGIAFARLKTPELAARAVHQLNGTWFSKSKKMLRVKLANKQLPRSASCVKFQKTSNNSSLPQMNSMSNFQSNSGSMASINGNGTANSTSISLSPMNHSVNLIQSMTQTNSAKRLNMMSHDDNVVGSSNPSQQTSISSSFTAASSSTSFPNLHNSPSAPLIEMSPSLSRSNDFQHHLSSSTSPRFMMSACKINDNSTASGHGGAISNMSKPNIMSNYSSSDRIGVISQHGHSTWSRELHQNDFRNIDDSKSSSISSSHMPYSDLIIKNINRKLMSNMDYNFYSNKHFQNNDLTNSQYFHPTDFLESRFKDITCSLESNGTMSNENISDHGVLINQDIRSSILQDIWKHQFNDLYNN